MKIFSLFIVFVCMSVSSCRHNQRDEVFISTTMEFSHGVFQASNYSLINIKQDSLYYFNFPNINDSMYIGKMNRKNRTVETNDDYKIKLDGNKLNIFDIEQIHNYVLLNKNVDIKGLEKSSFIGKKYAVKSKFVNDTISFINENTYLIIGSNKEFKWSYIDFKGYEFLWQESLVEEVPLQIVSVDDNGFKAMFYGLDEIEVVFKEVP